VAGAPAAVVQCFRAFYRSVRRRFRYGAVDGGVWYAANGLAQGCPASPDLLNILLEVFHRWAAASGLGVDVAGVGLRLGSVGFADDVALAAPSLEGITALVRAYLRWCRQLGVKVTKVQLYSSEGAGIEVTVDDFRVTTASTFKFVGIVLGRAEREATIEHFAPRLAKALDTTRRLRSLDLPASVCSLLWRVAVLPQALYGCQLRDIRPVDIDPLSKAGKAAVVHKAPCTSTAGGRTTR
jgi:hypothetical protein